MSVCVRFSKEMDNRRNSDCKTDTLSLLWSFVKDENSFYNYNYNAKSVNTVILSMYMRACVGKKGDIVIAQHSICMGWLRLVGSLNCMSLLQNIVSFIGLFCKETYNFKEPTIGSHPIAERVSHSIVYRSLL